MKKKRNFALLFGLIFIFSISAYAGTTSRSYDTTVGKFNGSGYTGYQVKDATGTPGDLNSTFVGGSYKVDGRMVDDSGDTGDWERNIDDWSVVTLDGDNQQLSGEEIRVQFSNDLSTPVDVQVTGSWKSN